MVENCSQQRNNEGIGSGVWLVSCAEGIKESEIQGWEGVGSSEGREECELSPG